ncbi:hypothetical protein [Thermovibrio sp.]
MPTENANVVIKVIEDGLLNAYKLPLYQVEPFEVWGKLSRAAKSLVSHSIDTYGIHEGIIDDLAQHYIDGAQKHLAMIGMTGGVGGPVGIATMVLDIEEYVRVLYRLAQELGYLYGVLPSPLVPKEEIATLSSEDYMYTIREDILKIIALGSGVGGISLAIREVAKQIAQKEAKEILRKKISDKVITQLAKQIAKILGVKLTKKTISKTILRIVPIVGGIVSAGINYYAIGELGRSMQNAIKRERERYRQILKETGHLY